MSLETHLDSLVQKHAHLEETLFEEAHRPQPDPVLMATLKKQKLQIKDEILRMQPEDVEH
jgi:hypothetical protein